MRRDPSTGKGFLLNLVKPIGLGDNSTKPFVDEVLTLTNAMDKTVFIGTLEDPKRTDIVDMIGIITGMEDGSARPPGKAKGHVPAPDRHLPHPVSADRWDIPIFR
ncbi:MAG: hypothetical protein JW939_09220, partial [Candidatus Thermoplasmatota archaeon]|nr:hypothetical protein [Candidatus Thermoplasmatota archaeon]